MALQAQQIDLAHSQESRIGRAMGGVATGAAFGFYRHMLVHKRPSRIGVALNASSIAAGQRLDLAQSGGPVNVMTVTAVNQPFIHAVVIRPGKISLSRGVARIALRGLFLDEQILWLFRVVRRVAVKATYIIARVG